MAIRTRTSAVHLALSCAVRWENCTRVRRRCAAVSQITHSTTGCDPTACCQRECPCSILHCDRYRALQHCQRHRYRAHCSIARDTDAEHTAALPETQIQSTLQRCQRHRYRAHCSIARDTDTEHAAALPDTAARNTSDETSTVTSIDSAECQ